MLDSKGDQKITGLRSQQSHTSQKQVAEMLILARRIVADTTCKFPPTQRLTGLNFVAVRQRLKATGNCVNEPGVEPVGREAVEWAFVRCVVAEGFGDGVEGLEGLEFISSW